MDDKSISSKIDKIVDTGNILASLGVEKSDSGEFGKSLSVQEANEKIVRNLLQHKNKGIICFLTLAGNTAKEFGITTDEAEPSLEVVLERFDRVRDVVYNTLDEISVLPSVLSFDNDLYEMFKDSLSDIRAKAQEDFYQRFRKDSGDSVLLKITVSHTDEIIAGACVERFCLKTMKRIPLFESGYFL